MDMDQDEEELAREDDFEEEEEELAREEDEFEEEEELASEEEEGNEGFDVNFCGDSDPVDLAMDECRGEDLYKHFKRLEYESLAERKREALRDDGLEKSARQQQDIVGASMEEIDEMMNFGLGRRRRRRRSRESKKKGRKKGSKNNLTPELTRKIGDATIHYASGNYKEAIPLLEEVVRFSCSSDAYYLLGLIYDAKGERRRALNFHMIAAHVSPKDPALWKKLVAWSIEDRNTGQLKYCLSKAISADPKDAGLRFDLALLHFELKEYQKAAGLYNQIVELHPRNIMARKMAAKMYQKCGQVEKAVGILEEFINDHSSEGDPSVVDLLITLQMESNAYSKALQQIEHACSGENMSLNLKAKAVICHAHLGNVENAEVFLKDMQMEEAGDYRDMITEVGDTFAKLGHHGYALNFYFMLEETTVHDSGVLHLRIAECYRSMKDVEKAVIFFFKALSTMEDDVDARITLSSILLEEGREDDAIKLLSAPQTSEDASNLNFPQSKAWWLSARIKWELGKIYRGKGMLKNFVDSISPFVRETLVVEAMNQKVKKRKRVTKKELFIRAKLLDGQPDDMVFRNKPVAPASAKVKAKRAKRKLEEKAALRGEQKAAAQAAGTDWQSEDSEEGDEAPLAEYKEPPLPGLLKDEEHCQLILDLCKALITLHQYLEALEIINLTLRLADRTLSAEKKEELRSLGGRIAYSTKDPKHGYNYVRYIVQQHPYSIAAWNCFYNVVSRSGTQIPRSYTKFVRHIRASLEDCMPPIVINGYQFTMLSQHQVAARDYLQAYKLQPEDPLINLCAGTALINLALGHRLQNKNQAVVQGFAFLYNYLRICSNSQEALYNVARAYHHVGLVTLAALYYEKVLSKQEKDYPLPKLPYQDSSVPVSQNPGYCNLHREAAYNLHLIYKKSGAVELARQMLKDYCTP